MRHKTQASNKAKESGLRFEAPVNALARWNPDVQAADKASDTVFNIYSEIGETWDGTGVTPEKLATFLDKADGKDIVVNINSPGGNFFDGLAMHTMLSEYDGNVTVKIVALAASAASMIAMAGDEILIAEAGLIMIHNAWSIAIGNSKDFAEAAQTLDKFDASMATLYVSKTGIKSKDIRDMMDAETWLDGAEAVSQGFADKMLGEKEIVESKAASPYNAALRQVDVTLAKAGMPRTERRALLKNLSNATPSAGDNPKTVTPSADTEKQKQVEALSALLKTLKE
jgi:ATP-dependent Clp protease protease subunit